MVSSPLLGLVAQICLAVALAGPTAADDCRSIHIGADPSLATGSASTILGKAVGETFRAATTRIKSITVWRVAVQDSLGFGIHLYICRVDSNGMPLTESLILDGPTFR